MRPRLAEPAPPGVVPTEIVIGPVVGVHGDDLLEAHRGYHAVRRGWERTASLDQAASYRLVPARGPVDGAAAVARLLRFGVVPEQVPALRAAASRWVAEAQ